MSLELYLDRECLTGYVGNFLVYREVDKKEPPPDTPLEEDIDGPRVALTKSEHQQPLGPFKSHKGVYHFKRNGLVKKTMSIVVNGIHQHLIAYFNQADVVNGQLRRPAQDPQIRNLQITIVSWQPEGGRVGRQNSRLTVGDAESHREIKPAYLRTLELAAHMLEAEQRHSNEHQEVSAAAEASSSLLGLSMLATSHPNISVSSSGLNSAQSTDRITLPSITSIVSSLNNSAGAYLAVPKLPQVGDSIGMAQPPPIMAPTGRELHVRARNSYPFTTGQHHYQGRLDGPASAPIRYMPYHFSHTGGSPSLGHLQAQVDRTFQDIKPLPPPIQAYSEPVSMGNSLNRLPPAMGDRSQQQILPPFSAQSDKTHHSWPH